MYYLLESVERNWLDIINILQHKDQLQKIENINITYVRGILKVLKHFEQASKTLEGENYTTLHLIYAYINGLKDSCGIQNNDNEIVKRFKEAIHEYLTTTVYSNIFITHKIAHFLFPPANKLQQFPENEKEIIISTCREELKSYSENEIIVESPASPEKSILYTYFNNFVTALIINSNDAISREIQTYRNLDIPFEENFDVFNWWYLHRSQFPMLYKLSCKILATPGSSAPSERVFSIVRQLLSEKRTKISSNSSTFSQICFFI